MVGTIILVWFANSTFLEKYYISNKVHAIYSAYESLDSAVVVAAYPLMNLIWNSDCMRYV